MRKKLECKEFMLRQGEQAESLIHQVQEFVGSNEVVDGGLETITSFGDWRHTGATTTAPAFLVWYWRKEFWDGK